MGGNSRLRSRTRRACVCSGPGWAMRVHVYTPVFIPAGPCVAAPVSSSCSVVCVCVYSRVRVCVHTCSGVRTPVPDTYVCILDLIKFLRREAEAQRRCLALPGAGRSPVGCGPGGQAGVHSASHVLGRMATRFISSCRALCPGGC